MLAGRHPGWRISRPLPGSLRSGFIAIEAVTGRRITAANVAGMDVALNGGDPALPGVSARLSAANTW